MKYERITAWLLPEQKKFVMKKGAKASERIRYALQKTFTIKKSAK